jgi:hypothetical protein
VQRSEEPNGHPETGRNFAPSAEIFSEVEQKKRTKKENSAETKI